MLQVKVNKRNYNYYLFYLYNDMMFVIIYITGLS